MALRERKRILEEWFKEGRNAEVEEGRAEVAAGGGVIRQAVAGPRSFEAKVELRLTDVDGRRGTEDTVVFGSGFTRLATDLLQSAEKVGNVLSVEESGCRKSKGADETLAVEGG